MRIGGVALSAKPLAVTSTIWRDRRNSQMQKCLCTRFMRMWTAERLCQRAADKELATWTKPTFSLSVKLQRLVLSGSLQFTWGGLFRDNELWDWGAGKRRWSATGFGFLAKCLVLGKTLLSASRVTIAPRRRNETRRSHDSVTNYRAHASNNSDVVICEWLHSRQVEYIFGFLTCFVSYVCITMFIIRFKCKLVNFDA